MAIYLSAICIQYSPTDTVQNIYLRFFLGNGLTPMTTRFSSHTAATA